VRENLVFDSLIYLEPVKRSKNRSNVMKFWSFGDGTSSRVKDKLKTICLCSRIELYFNRGTSSSALDAERNQLCDVN